VVCGQVVSVAELTTAVALREPHRANRQAERPGDHSMAGFVVGGAALALGHGEVRPSNCKGRGRRSGRSDPKSTATSVLSSPAIGHHGVGVAV
jgi:hypothetical protein